MPPSSASTIAYTRPDLAADAETPIFPRSAVGRPLFRLISVQVSPPSFDRQSPEPAPPETSAHGRRIASQNDAEIIRGLFGAVESADARALTLRYRTVPQ